MPQKQMNWPQTLATNIGQCKVEGFKTEGSSAKNASRDWMRLCYKKTDGLQFMLQNAPHGMRLCKPTGFLKLPLFGPMSSYSSWPRGILLKHFAKLLGLQEVFNHMLPKPKLALVVMSSQLGCGQTQHR